MSTTNDTKNTNGISIFLILNHNERKGSQRFSMLEIAGVGPSVA
jgi:hypothetical protein